MGQVISGHDMWDINHPHPQDGKPHPRPEMSGMAGLGGSEATPTGMPPGGWTQQSEGDHPGLRQYQGENFEVSADPVSATSKQISGMSMGMGNSNLAYDQSGRVQDARGGSNPAGFDVTGYNQTAAQMNKEGYGKKGAKTYMSYNLNSQQQSPAVLNRMAANTKLGGSQPSAMVEISNDASANEPSKRFEVTPGHPFGTPGSSAEQYANSQMGGSEDNIQKLPSTDQKKLAKPKAGH